MNDAQRRRPQGLDPDLEKEFASIADWSGCELVHATLNGGTLRLMIDREGGITHSDCETISKQVSALLDVVDFGHDRYVLEVTSPGLDRPLFRRGDYERFAGRRARITHYAEDRKVTVIGRLGGLVEDRAVLEADGGERLEIPLESISAARLEIEL
ncbi:MAG: ribosome maturation factor RimP [Acidobacteriota bacterium]